MALIFQAWALLERDASNTDLARELLKCAVKADPRSEPSWLVSSSSSAMGGQGWPLEGARELGVCPMQLLPQFFVGSLPVPADPDAVSAGC